MREQRTIGPLDALTGQVNYLEGPEHTGHRDQYLVIAGLPHVLAKIQSVSRKSIFERGGAP
jgi:hypothetical protein